MNHYLKKRFLGTVILVMLMISQAVSAAPLAYDSGPVSQFVYDTFTDNNTDPALWSYRIKDSGPTASETSQRLEITVPANSSGSDFAAWYDSTCILHGDYDIQVDYQVLTWPIESGVRFGITDQHVNMHRISSGIKPGDYDIPGGPDYYMTLFNTGAAWSSSGVTPTSDAFGKLRLVRADDTITSFYFDNLNSVWVPDASNSAQSYTDDTPFALGAWSADSVFTDQDVKIAFDNMIINTGELICPTTAASDLVITQVTDQATVSTGDPIGFTITITNNGDATAQIVQLTDPLPIANELKWTIGGTDASACLMASDGMVSCNFQNIAPGAVKTIRLTSPTTYVFGKGFCQVIDSTATLMEYNQPVNKTASASVNVQCPEVYGYVLAENPGYPAGDPISLDVEFGNYGDGIAKDFLAEVTLPTNPGLDWSISSIIPAEAANHCHFGNDPFGTYELICSFAQFAGNQAVNITLTSPTTTASCGPVDSGAYTSASNGPGRKMVMKSPMILCPVTTPDLVITQVADQATVSTGDPIGFTITVTNNGDATVNMVTLTNPLPIYAEFDWSIEGTHAGACSMTDGVVSCNFQDIAPDEVKTIRLTAPEYVNYGKCFSPIVTSTATLMAANQPVNKTATAITEVLCPSVYLGVWSDTLSVMAGDPVNYIVTIGNAGEGNAKDVHAFVDIQKAPGTSWVITDVTPDSAESNCTFGPYTGPYETWMELDCTFDSIAPLEEVIITLTSPTTSESCGTFGGDGGVSASNSVGHKIKVVYITVNCSVSDTTPPVITPTITGTLGQNGWYTSDVSLTWYVTDPESGTTSMTGCREETITQDQAVTEYGCSATSAGGTSSAHVSIGRDTTKPATTVAGVTEGVTYPLGSVPQAGCHTTDNLSGVATEATIAVTGGDAQGLGQITATCSGALDSAGNAADPAVVHYSVNRPSNTYNFTGFFQPVDNWPIENTMKAGSSVPFRFSLGGDMGLNIFGSGSPTSRQVDCPTSSALTADAIEETTTSSSGLTYDAASGQYIYVWKTNKNWTNTCRVFTIQFVDGSSKQALFKFNK